MHVELNGKAEWVVESRQKNGLDNSRTATTKISRETDASVCVEISEGHPNLDAWSSDYRVDSLASLAEREGDFREWSPIEGTWDVKIYGNSAEWVPTLISFLSERPELSISDVVSRFVGLDDVDESGLMKFYMEGEEEISNFDTPSGELTGDEWLKQVEDIKALGDS